MRALAIAFLLASPLRAERSGPVLTPSDEQLLSKMGLRQAYTEMWVHQPEIDRLLAELGEIRRGYSGKLKARPGGPRRNEVRAKLDVLFKDTWKRRMKFRDLGVDQRFNRAVAIAFDAREGRPEGVNLQLQTVIRHTALVDDSKAYFLEREAVMKAEQSVYEEAVRRFEAAAADRRRAVWGAGALASAALLVGGAVFWRTRSRPVPALPSPPAQPRVGRYLVERAGRPWAFGARFDAVEEGSGRAVSLGRLDDSIVARPLDAQAVLAGVRAGCSLSHPAVPALLDEFIEGTGVYLVTAPVAGKPLAAWLELGKPIPLADARRILLPVADALDCAHRKGLLHGALTPERILVGAAGAVAIEDFGLAPACLPSGRGEPAYMAPEQDRQRATAQSDLYSLGVVFYEMLTGRHPFEGVNLQAMKLEMRYTPPAQALSLVPPKLDALFAALLTPDPARRRPLPGTLRAALEGL